MTRRGPRSGEAVEKQPPGTAEHEAKRAEDNLPVDPVTGQPIEPEDRGRLERPASSTLPDDSED